MLLYCFTLFCTDVTSNRPDLQTLTCCIKNSSTVWHSRVVRGAMHSGKKCRSAVWLNAMHCGKKWWIPEFVLPSIYSSFAPSSLYSSLALRDSWPERFRDPWSYSWFCHSDLFYVILRRRSSEWLESSIESDLGNPNLQPWYAARIWLKSSRFLDFSYRENDLHLAVDSIAIFALGTRYIFPFWFCVDTFSSWMGYQVVWCARRRWRVL